MTTILCAIAAFVVLTWALERLLHRLAFRVVTDFDPHPTRGDEE